MADSLGDRMKLYERIAESSLIPRMPVLIRVDGKAFHTFTKGMDRPWDLRLVEAMHSTARYLCENIEGARVAFVQSDEITILLTDWERYNTQSWFGYRLQKMVSVAASMATVGFNQAALTHFQGSRWESRFAMFDARVWNLPRHEVANAFIWRQQDATRNSVQMLARAHFSHKQCDRKSQSQLQDMLMLEKGINWNDTPTHLRRGACVVKREGEEGRTGWVVDKEIPIFTQNRAYVEQHLTKLFWRESAPEEGGSHE
jgi:tRNA(His) guanylyltransferase